MGPSRQEYWSGLPLPSPGDLPNPGIEPGSPALEADALPSEPHKYTGRTYSELSHMLHIIRIIAMCVCVCVFVHMCICSFLSSPLLSSITGLDTVSISLEIFSHNYPVRKVQLLL